MIATQLELIKLSLDKNVLNANVATLIKAFSTRLSTKSPGQYQNDFKEISELKDVLSDSQPRLEDLNMVLALFGAIV